MPGSELRVSISITPGSSLKWILSLSHFPDGELEAQVGEAVSPGSYKQTRGPEYSGDSCYLAVGGGADHSHKLHLQEAFVLVSGAEDLRG